MATQKSALKLAKKEHTGFGVASLGLAILSLVLVAFAVLVSALEDRSHLSIQYVIGIAETVAMTGSLAGLIFGCIGERGKDTYKFTAHAGVAVNGILMIYHIAVIVFGYGA